MKTKWIFGFMLWGRGFFEGVVLRKRVRGERIQPTFLPSEVQREKERGEREMGSGKRRRENMKRMPLMENGGKGGNR